MRFDRREVWTMEKKTFAVIGGDIRYAHLASQLCADGHTVFAACLEKALKMIRTRRAAMGIKICLRTRLIRAAPALLRKDF